MAYDEGLAQRVREMLEDRDGFEAKQMFGGIGFMLQGNMCCGVSIEGLIVRVGPDQHDEALAQPHTAEFGPAGRTMRGWVTVAPEGLDEDEALSEWVRQGVEFALTLPPK